MNDGDVILLENTRFRPEETKNGEAFSKDLASIADVFVNDAFGTAHRAHCSNVGVTQYVDTAVVGYLMQKEIDFLGNAVNNPVRPFVAILEVQRFLLRFQLSIIFLIRLTHLLSVVVCLIHSRKHMVVM